MREAVGILPRREIARDLRRTANAAHRRLYDLGLNARTRWGLTQHRITQLTGVCDNTLNRYIRSGQLKPFRGYKYIYFDPADLLIVKEIDWSTVAPELEQAVRKSLMRKLCGTIIQSKCCGK